MPIRYSQKQVWASRLIEILIRSVSVVLFPLLFRSRKSEHMTVVLLEPFQMGDVLSLAVMLDPLLERFPHCRIVVWCHKKNAAVYRHDHRVWKVVTANFFWSNYKDKKGKKEDWRSIWDSIREIRSLGAHFGVDTRGDIRSQALLYAAGCQRRIGYTNYLCSNILLRGLLLTDNLGNGPLEHRYLLNLRSLKPILSAIPTLNLPALQGPRQPVPGLVVLHIGAGWEYKRWKIERWAEVVESLRRCPEVELVLLQGPGEKELVDALQSRLESPVACRETTYPEMVALLARAALFIGLDSGPMNVASLLGVPAIALFGPGDPLLWYPAVAGSRAVHHLDRYPCNPCLQKTCVRPNDSCMGTITVTEVLEASRSALLKTARPGPSEAIC